MTEFDWSELRAIFPDDFTDRQREVGAYMAVGYSRSEIADRMPITMPTIRQHMDAVTRKLKLDSWRRVPGYVIKRLL